MSPHTRDTHSPMALRRARSASQLFARQALTRRSRALAALLSLAAALALVFGVSGSRSAPAQSAATLTASGTVGATHQLALDFSSQGRLVEIDARPGQTVAAGQLLARLDPTAAVAALQTAEANLTSARAQLRQLYQGLSPAERLQLRVALSQARQTRASAAQSLLDARAAGSADATRLQAAVDQAQAQLAADQTKLVNDQAKTAADQSSLAADQQTAAAAATQLSADRTQLASDQSRLLAAQKTQADDQAANPPDQGKLAADAKAILDAQAAVSNDQAKLADDSTTAGEARSNATADQSRLTTDQQTVEADQDRVVADQDAVTNAVNAKGAGAVTDQQSLHSAQSTLSAAQLNTQATQAANAVHAQHSRVGATVSARSAVTVAAANVTLARQALQETRLVAPFAGTVADVNAVVGQIVGSSQSGALITLVDLNHLTVTATFSGAETVLLKPGDRATVTIPALEGQMLTGQVSAIDPLPIAASGDAASSNAPSTTGTSPTQTSAAAQSASVSADSVGYQTTITLNGAPATLRPGMAVAVTVTATVPLQRSER